MFDETGQNLHYVGYSMGALMIMAAVSKGQLLNMLRSVALLCPIAYMGHTPSPLSRFFADHYIPEALYRLGDYKFEMKSYAEYQWLIALTYSHHLLGKIAA